MAGSNRNGWQLCTGTGGRFWPECAPRDL